MSKQDVIVSGSDARGDFEDVVDENVPIKFRGTVRDREDMAVLGKKQVLRRNFKGITMLGFASMVMVSWEALLVYIDYPLTDGGTAVIFWGSLVAPLCLTFVYLSLAELASMAPTAGGQYHWVSELAPPRIQKQLSYVVGWLIALGWQTWLAGTCFLAAEALQGIIALNVPTYEIKGWQTTLFVIAIILFSTFFNTILANRLPYIEGMLLVLHVAGLFAIIIPLWIMGPRGEPHEVIFDWANEGYWSKGVSAMIGLPFLFGILYGFDCTVHMSEEIQDAARTIPPTIIWGFWSNATLMLIVAVTIIFTIGDIKEVLSTRTKQPFIQIFLNATGSYGATNTVTGMLCVTLVAACLSEVATASRQIWAFARDGGLPFSNFLGKVTPGWNIPLNAVCVSILFTTLLSLIYLGSEVALNAVTSLALLSILSSYLTTIGCLIWRRLFGEPLPPRPWSLGRWGLPINIIAFCMLLPILVFSVFPLYAPPFPLAYMNWSTTIFGGVVFIAAVFYVFKARHTYAGPVELVKRKTLEEAY